MREKASPSKIFKGRPDRWQIVPFGEIVDEFSLREKERVTDPDDRVCSALFRHRKRWSKVICCSDRQPNYVQVTCFRGS